MKGRSRPERVIDKKSCVIVENRGDILRHGFGFDNILATQVHIEFIRIQVLQHWTFPENEFRKEDTCMIADENVCS